MCGGYQKGTIGLLADYFTLFQGIDPVYIQRKMEGCDSLGMSLLPIIEMMYEWGEKRMEELKLEIGASPSQV